MVVGPVLVGSKVPAVSYEIAVARSTGSTPRALAVCAMPSRMDGSTLTDAAAPAPALGLVLAGLMPGESMFDALTSGACPMIRLNRSSAALRPAFSALPSR
ncbi:hypothetical protein BMJ30_32305 [Sinorhizobium medicae]|nr:hypothetical protein BMJ30_32305 [Sinorhizobium medicae]